MTQIGGCQHCLRGTRRLPPAWHRGPPRSPPPSLQALRQLCLVADGAGAAVQAVAVAGQAAGCNLAVGTAVGRPAQCTDTQGRPTQPPPKAPPAPNAHPTPALGPHCTKRRPVGPHPPSPPTFPSLRPPLLPAHHRGTYMQDTSPLCLLMLHLPSWHREHLLSWHCAPSNCGGQRHCLTPSLLIWHTPLFSQ